jgi:hypothetical protein
MIGRSLGRQKEYRIGLKFKFCPAGFNIADPSSLSIGHRRLLRLQLEICITKLPLRNHYRQPDKSLVHIGNLSNDKETSGKGMPQKWKNWLYKTLNSFI